MHKIIEKAKKEKRSLLETEAKELLREYGISVPDFKLIKSEDEIVGLAKEINFPIVMKIVSPDIIHKTEAGGVKVGIKDEKEAKAAYQDIIYKVKKYKKEAKISGIIAYSMIPQGTEIIIGIMKDPHFGPVIMFGLGGIFVEILKDISFRILPLEERDAEEMISEIKGYQILKGIRGETPKDVKSIRDVLMKISQLVMDNPEIKEIDLNPVFLFNQGLQVVDARMIL
ncbi:MAG: acetyl-CoA synthetase [Candidatus Infernicultor aquiphilus]|uniref:Acetyl-CoA synthetase n=1 Tax=Candidatus Infernicultor aquiphilus TaxID=1805029 RepID=A0A2M7K895_9BACT|nr:MAG: acetyl-CoA synthetase [Candidatus Atribacteria bacterium CG_4_8_14_3_um_filter_34_18]